MRETHRNSALSVRDKSRYQLGRETSECYTAVFNFAIPIKTYVTVWKKQTWTQTVKTSKQSF